jgi:hypothetical protein
MQFTILDIKEQRVRVASVAVSRCRQSAAARQGGGIHFEHMRHRFQSAVAVLAFHIAHQIRAIFQLQTHAGDTDFFRVLHGITVAIDKYFSDYTSFFAEHAASDFEPEARFVRANRIRYRLNYINTRDSGPRAVS